MIRYKSTRGSQNAKSSAQAIIRGIAEDRGLYVPDAFPALSKAPEDMLDCDYRQVAAAVLPAFLSDYTQEELRACNRGAGGRSGGKGGQCLVFGALPRKDGGI